MGIFTGKKRGQIESKVFVYIFSAIIVILIVFYSFKALNSFKDERRKAILAELKEKVKSAIEIGANNYGSARSYSIRVPDDVAKVCFVDLSQRAAFNTSDLANKYPVIKNVVMDESDYNMFLITFADEVSDMTYAGEICFTEGTPYRCIETPKGILNMIIEGKGGCAEIIGGLELINISNEKNDALYVNHPIVIMSADEDWKTILSVTPIALWNNKDGGIESVPYLVFRMSPPVTENDFLISYFATMYGSSEFRVFHNSTVFPSALCGGAPPCVISGISITEEDIGIPANYDAYWTKMDDIVITGPTNTEGALITSLLASYLVSPLYFVDTNNLEIHNDEHILGRRVFVVDATTVDPAVLAYIDANAESRIDFTSDQIRNDPQINPYRAMYADILPSIYFSP